MSLDARQTDSPPVTARAELERFFAEAERPEGQGLIGLEHEKLLVGAQSTTAIPYEGRPSVGGLLGAFAADGWEEYREGPGLPPIALTKGTAAISLEPGGQFEWAGSPHPTARAAHEETAAHSRRLTELASAQGVRVIALGYRPFDRIPTMPWMPKSRYGAMKSTLGAAGSHALDMMLMTATGQVSLDWSSEADCAKKVTAAARISPITVALFANSPVVQGANSGFQSFRSRVWNDVDPSRCGTPAFLVDGSFSYARYVEWALAAPLLFLRRAGTYHTPKLTFGQLLEAGFEGRPATKSDWVDHLSTLFPEVRIKKVLEVRSADSNGVAMTGALAALMRGLLYDRSATQSAIDLLKLTPEEHRDLHHAAQRDGLEAVVGKHSLIDLAQAVVEVAKDGLRRVDPLDLPLLEPLELVLKRRRSPARDVLEAFERRSSDSAFLDGFRL